MLRIDRDAKSLKRLEEKLSAEAGLLERSDIQRMIRNSPEAFFAEMGEELLLLGEEVRPAEFVADRIDLLAIDQQGATVVLELKRGNDKLQLLQALPYASMVAAWDSQQIVSERSRFAGTSVEQAEEDIEQFLLEDIGELNESQRVVLLADGFDYDVLVTAKWLTENYDVDIRCYRLSVSRDDGADYLSCTCIYPPPELAEHAVRRRRRGSKRTPRWPDWEAVFDITENSAVEEFFRQELQAGRENYLRQRVLRYRVEGKRRLNVHARRKKAYVWQNGRFPGDEEFWSERLGEGADTEPVKDGQSLRFYLSSEADFQRFKEAVEEELGGVEFFDDGLPEEGEGYEL
ncbi:MAG: hypothetical protein R6X33_03130 [Candidatus Brocadiia bacterium]